MLQYGRSTYPAINKDTLTTKTLSLPVAFSEKTYSISIGFITDGGNTAYLRQNRITAQTTTNITIGWYSAQTSSKSGEFCYILLGY